MTDFERFFQGLSDRMWKENGLSDITYALCRGNLVFLRFFVDFFFKDFNLEPTNLKIEREYDDGIGNRPDFRVTDQRNGEFYIEVKIWNRKHHFKSYVQSLEQNNHADDGISPISTDEAKKHLGYIAAYKITPLDVSDSIGCPNVKTWEELYSELKRWSFFEDETIRAYGSYLSRVCGLQSKMDLDSYRFVPSNFVDIHKFMNEVDAALESQKERLSLYTRSSRWFRSNAWMGRFFEWKKYAGGDYSVWGWLGASIGDDCPQIYVWFEDRQGWGNLVCEHFGRPMDESRSIWYSKYDKSLYLFMTNRDNGNINTFLERALTTLSDSCDYQKIDAMPKRGDLPERFQALLAMRQLPMSIEKYYFATDNDFCRIIPFERDEDPNSRCHVRFKVESDNEGITKSITGWVGVDFDENIQTPKLQFCVNGEGNQDSVELENGKGDGDMAKLAKIFQSKLNEELKRRRFLS